MSHKENDRRKFLQFMGYGAAAAAFSPLLTSPLNAWAAAKNKIGKSTAPFPSLGNGAGLDALTVAPGMHYDRLISWGDPIDRKGTPFGINNDYIALIEESATRATMWVNHEYPTPLLMHRRNVTIEDKTRAEVEVERQAVGGTLMRLKRAKADARWEVDLDASLNRRINGLTPIPFTGKDAIAGSRQAIGTMGNCAGGITPWGTFLSCEENYEDYFPDPNEACLMGWYKHLDFPQEHYGWVVEIDSKTGAARKLVSLGRMRHECATVKLTSDQRPVVYMGEDKIDSFLFKFVGNAPRDLENGTLYCASLEKGRWIALTRDSHPELKKRFKTQTDLLVHAAEAAQIVGATPLDRPEDIEINPANGDVLVSCTNNKPRNRPFGAILRIREKGAKPEAMEFQSDVFLPGGAASGISCPDNLAFDPRGGLWVTTDISGSAMNHPPYTEFGNNALFYVPMQGANAGKAIRAVNAPNGSELTGPFFQNDGKILFLSIQHPAEGSTLENLSSHWPDGGDAIPRSSIVQIYGPGLNAAAAK